MSKKYMCEKCGKSFINNRDLHKHMSKIKPCVKNPGVFPPVQVALYEALRLDGPEDGRGTGNPNWVF